MVVEDTDEHCLGSSNLSQRIHVVVFLVKQNAGEPKQTRSFLTTSVLETLCTPTAPTVGLLLRKNKQVLGDEGYSKPADIFSVGILIWEAFVRRGVDNPLCGLAGEACWKALIEGVRPALPLTMPHVVKGLVKRCWAFEPGDRPTADVVATELIAYAGI